MPECRLIYRSESTEEVVSNETMKSIVEKGAAHNKEQNISGLLILAGNHFLQVLEGPGDAVNELYLKITKDARHHRIRLLSFEMIASRYFDTWNMRLIDLWDLSGSEREFLKGKYPCKDDEILIPDSFLEIHSLLMDAKYFCLAQPWKQKHS